MRKKPDYQALRAAAGRNSPACLSDAVRDERRREQKRRASRAQIRALTALRQLYPRDYRDLYEAARAEVDAESGPLPGDVP